jgi:hypothetical protein
MIHLLHLWLRFLLLVLGSLSLLSIVTLIVKIELNKRSFNAKNLESFWRVLNENAQGTRIKLRAIKSSYLTVGLVVGFFSGHIYEQLKHYKKTFVLNDLQIVKKYEPEEKYLLAFSDTHLSFVTKICDDYKPNFQEGAKLKLLVYEDRGTCWSVAGEKLGYKYERAY